MRWTEVTNKSQIWQYLMGDSNGQEDVVLGDQFVALFSNHNKWVSCPSRINLSNDRTWLKQWERFRIEEAGPGKWAFKSSSGYYWSAQPYGMFIQANRSRVGKWEAFTLYVNEFQDRLLVKSAHGKYLSAQSNGAMRINRDKITPNEQFRGWKKGYRYQWTAVDKFDLVGYLDNRKFNCEGELVYQRKVGTSITNKLPEFIVHPSVKLSTSGLCGAMGAIVSRVGVSWGKVGAGIFEDQVKSLGSLKVPARTRMWLYQVVSSYGPFTIRTSFFKTEQDRSDDDDDVDEDDEGYRS